MLSSKQLIFENSKLDFLTSNELNDEDIVLEVVNFDNYSGFYTSLDMTSLATFVHNEQGIRSQNVDENSQIQGYSSRLTLGYERLHTVPKTLCDRFGSSLEILDISHNKIKHLNFLKHFTKLTSLIADNNLINSNTFLPPMPKLELLWLNHCKIDQLFPWIRRLKESCPNLKYISMMGNLSAPSYFNGGSFYEYLQYRLFVISLFPNLVHLDDRAVTKDQRAEAKRLYKRPLLERLVNYSNSDYTSIRIDKPTLERWKAVHQKLANLFETPPSSTNTRNNRNLLI